MKTLTQYVHDYIDEAFRINKDTKLNKHNYHPKTKDELKELVKQLLTERGKDADLNDIDVSEITDMSNLFFGVDIGNIDISAWDVSNVTEMNSMFWDCEDFNCDLSNWDVSNLTETRNMFYNCYKFNSDLSKWNVSKLKDMRYMFYNCDKLKNIPDWFKP